MLGPSGQLIGLEGSEVGFGGHRAEHGYILSGRAAGGNWWRASVPRGTPASARYNRIDASRQETKPRYYEVLAQASVDARSGTAAFPRLQPLAQYGNPIRHPGRPGSVGTPEAVDPVLGPR